jgi:tetratricopeptide (TPR) repeat protein
MYRLEPSYNSAYALFRLYTAKDDLTNAIKFMEEAIAAEESDAATDAQYYYELAVACYKGGNSPKAFESALKAAEDQTLAGKAYMLCGTIWGTLSCGGDEIAKRAQFWVAVDYLNKAKAADETLAESATNQIRQYSTYYPQTAEAFMYDLTDGQSYSVSCGGMKANTTVRTQK